MNRDLQLEILKMLSEVYPGHGESELFKSHDAFIEMYYLMEHGLIDRAMNDSSLLARKRFIKARLTNKGRDFLADDGGLSAILGVQVIKFHDETLRALLMAKIDRADLPPEQKQSMTDALQQLPAESIKHLTLRLLDKAVDSMPAIFAAVRTMGA